MSNSQQLTVSLDDMNIDDIFLNKCVHTILIVGSLNVCENFIHSDETRCKHSWNFDVPEIPY